MWLTPERTAGPAQLFTGRCYWRVTTSGYPQVTFGMQGPRVEVRAARTIRRQPDIRAGSGREPTAQSRASQRPSPPAPRPAAADQTTYQAAAAARPLVLRSTASQAKVDSVV